MNSRVLTLLLVITDWLTALLSWASFFYIRKTEFEGVAFYANDRFLLGISLIPFIWLLIYALQGTYLDVRRLHRLKIFNHTFIATLIGSVLLFFTFLLDDEITGYKQYYRSLFLLFGLHFSLAFLPRYLIVNWIVRQVHQRKAGFKTLIIGGSAKAVNIFNEIQNLRKGSGHNFVGFVNINGVDKELESKLNYLGNIDDLEVLLRKHEVEEVIIALESAEHQKIRPIITRLSDGDVRIKVLPDMYDILAGSVQMNNIFGALLLKVKSNVMPVWQVVVKRVMDIVLSLIAIVLLIPVYLTLCILVKSSSKGPIFFLQERIGKNGKVFNIIKFRTMIVDAEKSGPQLSSSNDPRITQSGRFMRKTRLDELPQFFNVLLGEMSLVGPRPERQFYIDQIAEIEPQFLELTKVRPGITSWGQVKYGYAENIEQMVDRMKYDLLYLRNRSIALDIKIMLFTIGIVFKGSGK